MPDLAATSTAPTTTPSTAATPGPTAYRLTFTRVLRSEWIRLVTTRSTRWTLLATGLVMVAIGLVAASVSGSGTSDQPGGPTPAFETSDPMATLMAGATPGFLLMVVLGVIVGAREYGTGLARTTYAAVPRRWPVVLGRMLVLAAAATVVVGLGALIAFVGGNAVLSASDAPTAAWGDDGVVRALLGNVGYLVGSAVIGVAVGTLTRSIGSGLGIVIGLGLVLPAFGTLLLPEDYQGVLDYLPSQAGMSFTALDAGSDYLSVGVGAAVFLAWVLGTGTAALVSVLRRDV